jgi:hypothetical protein
MIKMAKLQGIDPDLVHKNEQGLDREVLKSCQPHAQLWNGVLADVYYIAFPSRPIHMRSSGNLPAFHMLMSSYRHGLVSCGVKQFEYLAHMSIIPRLSGCTDMENTSYHNINIILI